MTSFGTIPLDDVWAMLNHCAPGYTAKETVHHWCVRYRDATYPTLPLGPHGARRNVRVQIGKVRQMMRQLDIELCGKNFLGLP